MKLELEDLKVLCDIAIKTTRDVGEMIQSHVGRDFDVQGKTAGSSAASQIVTEVDLKSQDMILEAIQESLEKFDLGLLIEESEDDGSRFQKDYFWCIDPLDGTLPFVEQRPGYAVSMALVSKEGEACIGVVYDPLRSVMYHAIKGAGAFRDGELWACDKAFSGNYETIYRGGAVMNACYALEEAPACFMKQPKQEEGGGCLWDYAAIVCIYQEWGGLATDRSGQLLNLNSTKSLFMNEKGVLFVSHPEIVSLLPFFSCDSY